jgi:hypothetical protein
VWPVIRRVILVLEGLAALVLAAAAARYERFDYLWAALAAGVLPLVYSVAGIFRSEGWGRVLRLVGALVMAVALAGSAVLVTGACANRVGPEADLAGCDFHDTLLVSEDLHGADLSDADRRAPISCGQTCPGRICPERTCAAPRSPSRTCPAPT